MDRDGQGTDSREEIVALITDEMSQIKTTLKEIKTQMEQTQMVVDREQQKYSDIANDLRRMQDILDTVPRQDIKDKYEEALDSRYRMLTMRGQLEKFQANYDNLEKEQTLLSQILGKLQGVSVLTEADEVHDTATKGAVNIVRIVQAQEDERERLARQMHDGPAQSLTNFILQAEICQRLFDRNPERAAEELDNLKTAASVTFKKVRDFIFDLQPMMLHDLGVVPTVKRYVDTFKEKTDIGADLEIAGEGRLEKHREVMIFRGIQDLLGHARDYATATQLKVKLDMLGNMVKIAVEDNGRAIDAENVLRGEESNQDPRSQGLITLKEKFELIGGSMSIQSAENLGTTVRLELPAGDHQ